MWYIQKIMSIKGMDTLFLSLLHMENLSIYYIDNVFFYNMYRKHVHIQYRQKIRSFIPDKDNFSRCHADKSIFLYIA